MAKLNVTIPANEVVIEGATYRKVDRAAAAGDVVKITEEDAHDSGALTFDAFYRVERMDSAHDPQIIDNYGDEMDLCGWEFEVYEKVSEPVRRLTVGDYVKVTDDKTSWGHTREGVTVGEIREIVFVDSSDCPFRAERLDGTGRVWFREDALVLATEAEVAEAKRKIAQTSDPRSQFAKGDKVRLVSGGGDHPLYGCPNGKVYEVKDPYTTMHSGTRVKITRTDGVGIGFALPSEIVKLTAEEIEALDRIPVGSYVRVLTDEKDLPKDTIGKVTVDDKDSRPYRVEPLVGRDWDWYRKDQLEVLTEAEAEQAAEVAKWAAIGRKVNEYKAGDIVKYVKATIPHGLNEHVGITTEISSVKDWGNPIRLVKPSYISSSVDTWTRVESLELIVPVESRFDRSKPKGGAA